MTLLGGGGVGCHVAGHESTTFEEQKHDWCGNDEDVLSHV